MYKIFLTILLVSGSRISFAQDDNFNDKIEEYLQPFISNQVFSGDILIAKGNKIFYHKAFGYSDFTSKIKNTTQTHFRIASLTKQFTQIAIEILEIKGRLKRTDTLNKYLKDFPNADKITISQLINHRSGIKDINSLAAYDELSTHRYTTRDVYNIVKNLPFDFAPGSARSYSNSGYVVLAKLIEDLSGISYPAFLNKEIFQPLGMSDTYIDDRKIDLRSEATGQMPDPSGDGFKKSFQWDPTIKMGGGCLTSTTEDMYKLFYAAYTGKIGIPPGPVRDSNRVDSYTGNSPGFTSFVKRYFRDDLYIIVLSNNHSRAAWNVGHSIGEIVMGRQSATNIVPDLIALNTESVKTFLGQHKAGSFEFHFYVKNDKLFLSAAGANGPDPFKTSRVYAVSANSFFIPFYWAVISFKIENDRVTEIEWKDIL